jgi:hypothetical protein
MVKILNREAIRVAKGSSATEEWCATKGTAGVNISHPPEKEREFIRRARICLIRKVASGIDNPQHPLGIGISRDAGPLYLLEAFQAIPSRRRIDQSRR